MAKMNYQRKQQSNRYISYQNYTSEVATPKQISLMGKLGISYHGGMSRRDCSIHIGQAIRSKKAAKND